MGEFVEDKNEKNGEILNSTNIYIIELFKISHKIVFYPPIYQDEGTEKVDNTACIWYNVFIKYRRCFYDRSTAEIGVNSIHGNI